MMTPTMTAFLTTSTSMMTMMGLSMQVTIFLILKIVIKTQGTMTTMETIFKIWTRMRTGMEYQMKVQNSSCKMIQLS